MSRGRFLAFIDDDCIPHSGWLSALVRELERRPDHLLGGRVTNGLPDDPYATATQSITTYARHYYRSEAANEPFFTTNNLALSTERFRHVGGFDTSIRSWTGEDREFCDRWRSFNYPMAEVLDAEVVHAYPLDARELPPATLQLWARHSGGPSHSAGSAGRLGSLPSPSPFIGT